MPYSDVFDGVFQQSKCDNFHKLDGLASFNSVSI